MPRREIKSEGKDVAAAIIRGLNELGRRRDQVEVTVVQEEKAGFLGIGGKPAIVHIIEKKWDSEHSTPIKPRAPRAAASSSSSSSSSFKTRGGGRKRREDTRRPSSRTRIDREPKAPKENEAQKLPSLEIQNTVIPENLKQPMALAKQCLETMLAGIGTKPENLNVWWDEKQQRILLTFDCDHPAIVIGKEGKTLESIQYLITLMVSRGFDNPISVMADTQNYWRKLEDKINSEIDKAVSMLKRTKRTYRFRPMSAQMRRYIHRYLVTDTAISTASEGEGKWRKVVLKLQSNTNAEATANLAAADTEAFEQPCVEETAEVAAENKAQCGCDSSCTCGCQEGNPCTCTDENCGEEAHSDECCCCHEENNEEAQAESCCCSAEEAAQETCCCCQEEAHQEAAQEIVKEQEVPAAPAVIPADQTVSTDNAGCDCVVSAETTDCECVADVTAPQPAPEAAAQPTEEKKEENK